MGFAMTATADNLEQDVQTPDTEAVAPVSKIVERCFNAYRRVQDFIWSREFHTIPTVMSIIGIVILLSLGTWQMIRLQQKNTMLRMIEAQLAQPPVNITGTFSKDETAWQNLHYRPVTLHGHFLPLYQFKLAPRTYEGQVGYQLIMPMELENRQIVLVNRGFVADGVAILPATDEKTAIQGIARIPEAEKPAYMPENIPSRGVWAWLDAQAMGHEIGVRNVAPVVVYETRDNARDTYPIGGHIPLPSHNRHWHYAVTWYCLALALMGVWIMASGPKTNPDDVKKPAHDTENMDPVARRGMYPEATD